MSIPKQTLKEALKTERLTPFGNALAGAMGAVVSSALVYPLDTVKTRIQGSSSSSSSPSTDPKQMKAKKNQILSVLLKTYENEGIEGFFKGFGANMTATFSMQFAYFFFHSLIRKFILRRLKLKSLGTGVELLLGALAGMLAQVFTIPVAVIATRQQLHVSGSSSSPSSSSSSSSSSSPSPCSSSSTSRQTGTKEKDPNMLQTAQEIISESGLSGLWTGLKPGLVLTVNPAITYGVFERLKTMVLLSQGLGEGAEGARMGPGWNFLLGVGSKSLATVVTYPYIFAKVRLQAKPSKSTSETIEPPAISDQEKPVEPEKEKDVEGYGTDGTSFAEVLKHEPKNVHDGGVVTEEDLEANKKDSIHLDNKRDEQEDTKEEKEEKREPQPSFAEVLKHSPAHVHQDGLVTETDLQANKTDQNSLPNPIPESPVSPKSNPAPVQGSPQHPLSTPANRMRAGDQKRFNSAIDLLRYTYQTKGFKGWYQGMTAQILKAVLSQGILFMLKDQFERYALILIILARRALSGR